MLPTSVGVISGASIGGGNYTASIFFLDGSAAKFLRVGDTVEDKIGNRYAVTTWTIFPTDFASGGVVTMSFITVDITPAVSAGFDASIFTPNQVDVRTDVRTAGTLSSPSIFSGQAFEYTVSGAWSDGTEASKAVVGDRVVDTEGKEYEISFIDPGGFAFPFRCIEVNKEGVTPGVGPASLFRSTVNFDFFQGTPITDPARTVVRNRDDFIIDANLKSIQDSISASNSSLSTTIVNNTGFSIAKGTPVRIDSLGDIADIDTSVEDEALATVGVASENIANGASGTIIMAGRVTDIATTATFDDYVYISSTGGITNVKPDIGVGGFTVGDFVISIGVISKNIATPALKDLMVNVQIVGQL